MSGDFRILAMDEYLRDLAAKRRILEQKCQIRQVTAAEFQALRLETVRKTQSRTSANNTYAHDRNVKLLEDMNTSIHTSSTRALLEDAKLLNSAHRLESARELYTRTAGDMLPAWRSYRSDMQLQAVAELRQQRETIERRRERQMMDAEEDLRNSIVLEEERRRYLLAVALENRDADFLRSQSRSLLEESRAVDYLMTKEVDKHRQQTHHRDTQVLTEMQGRLGAALDATANNDGVNGGKVSASVSAYRQAMTSPGRIVQALRDTPLPPPITVRTEDFDLPSRRHQQTRSGDGVGVQHINNNSNNENDSSDYSGGDDRGCSNNTKTADRRHIQQHQRKGETGVEAGSGDSRGDNNNNSSSSSSTRVRVVNNGSFSFSSDSENDSVYGHAHTATPTAVPTPKTDISTRPHSNRKLATPQSSFGKLHKDDASSSSPHMQSHQHPPASLTTPGSNKGAVQIPAAATGSPEARGGAGEAMYDAILAYTTSDKIELLDRLFRRLEVLDDVSRERGHEGGSSSVNGDAQQQYQQQQYQQQYQYSQHQQHRELRREDQFLTAIQAYRRVSRSVIGYSSTPANIPPSTAPTIAKANSSGELKVKLVPEYLHDLCRAVLDGRERETALHGIETIAEAIMHLIVDVGPYLLPSDILNGVITEDKVHRHLRRLGGGRMQLWHIITIHLKGLVGSNGARPEEISRIFTAALVLHLSHGDEQHRAERKIRTLIQLEIMPKESEHQQQTVTTNPTLSVASMNINTTVDPSISGGVVSSEPAKRITSPQAAAARTSPRGSSSSSAAAIGVENDSDEGIFMGTSATSQQGKEKKLSSSDSSSSSSSPYSSPDRRMDIGAGPLLRMPSREGTEPVSLGSSVGGGRHQTTTMTAPIPTSTISTAMPMKGNNLNTNANNINSTNNNTSDNNISMTSAVPQAIKFSMGVNSNSSSSIPNKNAGGTSKWLSAKNIMTVEDDELASDDDNAILAPPPMKLLEEIDSDASNEFDF